MRRKKLSEAEKQFVDEIRVIEERLFCDQLDESDSSRMKSDRYSWHYRPSHHIASELLTKDHIESLSEPNKRLLSIGAFPAYFEQVLIELGIPPENILLADNDPAIMKLNSPMQTIVFDANEPWPEIGMFDLIMFPESLCIMISDKLKPEELRRNTEFPNDAPEAEMLAKILGQSLERLNPGGEIRANGPMSHPNVVKAMSKILDAKEIGHEIEYERFLLTVRRKSHFRNPKDA